jgi:lipopolysaccharide export system protein LptA
MKKVLGLMPFIILFLVENRVVLAETASSTAASVAKQNVLSKDFGDFNQDSNIPVKITSDTVTLDANKRIFEYKGNVVVTREDMVLKSETMAGTYNEENKLEKIIFNNNVTMTKGTDMSARADRAEYDILEDKITMIGSPEVIDKSNKLTADKIIVFIKEQRSVAEGRVKVDFINKR